MATAFTPQERETITAALLSAARRCACSMGLKKTTLEALTQQAGISKSAFYAFFPSKEHLFLQVHAQWHCEIFKYAHAALEGAQALPPRERAAYILEQTLCAIAHSDMFHYAIEDWVLMERKLPPDELQHIAQTDTQLVRALIDKAGITLSVPLEDASAIVCILLMSLRVRASVGPYFDRGMSRLVHAACVQCIRE